MNTSNAFLQGSGASLLIYVAIIALFAAGLIVCAFPVVETRRRLRSGMRAIRGKNKKRSWQDEDFLGKGGLRIQWSAYLKNLHFSDGGYNVATNVEDFINEETVVYGPGRTAFADAIPGLLVSLGFLGTLIGLSGGLAGFNMTNSETAQQSIVVLIPAMKYAFTTSIVGVIASVLFTMVTRAVNGSAEKTLQEFYNVLNTCTGVHSVDPLTQIATYQQELNDLMRVIVQDINGRFTDRLSEIMAQSMKPMQQTLEHYVSISTKEQMRFLDNIVTRFIERMNAALENKLGELTAAIDESIRAQRLSQETLNESIAETGGLLERMHEMQMLSGSLAGAMRQLLDDLSRAQDNTDDNFDRIAAAVEKMDIISRQQTGFLKSVSAFTADATRALDKLTGTVEPLCERLANENLTAQEITMQATDEMAKTAEQLEKLQKTSLRVVESELNTMLAQYREYAEHLAKSVCKLTEGLDKELKLIPGTVRESCDALLVETEHIAATLKDASRALDDAVDKLYEDKG